MISMLLLTSTVSTGLSNGYQRVYAAGDFPTSDLGTQIREWVNNQISEGLFQSSSCGALKITLTGFPHQTGQSITNVGLTLESARPHVVCVGDSNVVIPGIGEGHVHVRVIIDTSRFAGSSAYVEISGLPGQTFKGGGSVNFSIDNPSTIDIPGIGIGQMRVDLNP
jgi:hypothetical protein